MADIVTTANLQEPDAFYADLVAAHDGLSKDESDAYNARLILLMANQIGDHVILKKLLQEAQRTSRKA
ncbi:DUF2783 domain-containing protein [Labrenzia sp. 011]|uniref:DUF2783 domain-containing protein n=1 Tax=Labrenzia sp. 011 TaxID=2171494 RepID=UPI000D507CF1|nr:DUF2783 domain-containing protein [Labrenzia sp. 011]PVB59744.1 DUF2783 domain-containing protein [Labrenzia sp. 011]